MADCHFKRCKKCGETKPVQEFPLNGGKPRARCKPCHTQDARRWAIENHDRYTQRLRGWHQKNKPPRFMGAPMPDHIRKIRERERREAWKKAHPEEFKASQEKWAANNKHVSMEVVRRRQAAKLQATPHWADHKVMQAFYKLAKQLSASGIPHDVDHIVPLKHPLVCGLHCPANLQVIPRKENRAKWNRWWPDMP
jgi:hypothetical protein